jgi:excisionase family DNA binding protein
MLLEGALRSLIREEVRAEVRAALDEYLRGWALVPIDQCAPGGYASLEVLAKKYGVSGSYLRRCAREGKLKALQAGRKWTAREEDVIEFMKPKPRKSKTEYSEDLHERARQILAKGRKTP